MAPPRDEEDWVWSYGLSGSLLSADGVLMDFIEHSFELLTCPDTPTAQVLYPATDAVHLWGQKPTPITTERDYATMHDHFLEALLQEQARKPRARSESSSPPPIMVCCSDSVTSQESIQPAPKKRRALRLHRRHTFSPSRQKRQVHIDMGQQQEEDDSSYAPKRLRLEDLTGQHPPPHTFVDPNCRMQKDKGKGELPGIDVCAEGRTACLHKLRQKIQLLAQASLGNTSGNAEMKRRRARIVDITSQHVETRSVIQLRMGFLAMQYGVLLRWDRTTHLIHFVVLRKMCSESFYNKVLPSSSSNVEPTPTPPSVTSPSTYELQNVVDGNHAILQLENGCEVALLEPPYLVDRPESFTPSVLRVNVTNVDGLKPLSTWIVKIRLENVSQTLRLGWNNQDGASFEPRNSGSTKTKLEWQVPPSFIDLQLEVIVYEQRRRENRRTLLHTTIPVPLSFLSPFSSNETAKSKQVVIDVDDASSLTLAIHHQSDYAHWLQREVDARKEEEEEEVRGYLWMSPFFSSVPHVESAIVKTSMSPFNLCCAW